VTPLTYAYSRNLSVTVDSDSKISQNTETLMFNSARSSNSALYSTVCTPYSSDIPPESVCVGACVGVGGDVTSFLFSSCIGQFRSGLLAPRASG
jgi:hypothetical protein